MTVLMPPKNDPHKALAQVNRDLAAKEPTDLTAIELRRFRDELESGIYAIETDRHNGIRIEGDVLRWESNGSVPPEEVLRGLFALGCITAGQLHASAQTRDEETKRFLAEYRRNPPTISPESSAEMHAELGPDVVDAITGRPLIG